MIIFGKEMPMRRGFIWTAGVLFILSNFFQAGAVLGEDVMVDGARRYQTMEGFGT